MVNTITPIVKLPVFLVNNVKFGFLFVLFFDNKDKMSVFQQIAEDKTAIVTIVHQQANYFGLPENRYRQSLC